MKASQILGFLVIGLLAVALLGGGCAFQGYNKAISLDEAVKNQWSQVDNQLLRRYELIPNLVETVKGVAGQEQKVFLGVAEARKAYVGARTVADKAEAATQVESALSRLLVFTENYPQLRSTEAFLKLQDSLEGTENRLSVERGKYNDKVRELNTFARQFPGRFFASLAGVSEAKYFEVPTESKTAPKVDFSDKPAKGPTENTAPAEKTPAE